jgi:hypothetical protein
VISKFFQKIDKKTMVNWLPAIAVMTLIFCLSAVPGRTLVAIGFKKESWHVDSHFLFYLLLAFTYFKAVKKVPWIVILSLLYALSDEFHQLYVPLRSASLKDIITDLVASLVAALILWKLPRILPSKLRVWLNN